MSLVLSNSEYEKIIQTYRNRRLNANHLLDERMREIYEKVPQYKEAEDEITSKNISLIKAKMMKNAEECEALREDIEDLRRKRKYLLMNAGYSINYLDDVYICHDCKDTGYINNEKCHCFKQAEIDYLYRQSNIKEILEEENFDNISLDYHTGDNKKRYMNAYNFALKLCNNFETEYNNMFLYGSVGTGKTYLTNCIVDKIIKNGYICVYFSANSLFSCLSEYKFNNNFKENIANPYEDIYNCDLLVIDDLGSELTNSFTSSELFNIINERHLRKKSTIISSNLDLNEFRDRYSDKISSRVINQYKLFKVTGDDIRLLNKLKKAEIN